MQAPTQAHTQDLDKLKSLSTIVGKHTNLITLIIKGDSQL